MAASRSTRHDAIRVVEAAYDLDPALNETQWCTGVLSALRPMFDRGLGVCAFVTDAERPFEEIAAFDVPDGWDRAMHALMASEAGPSLRASGPSKTASSAVGKAAFRSNSAMLAEWHPRGVVDGLGLTAHDGTGRVLTFAAPMAAIGTIPAVEANRFAKVAAHIGAGWRLRRGLSVPAAAGSEGEAVLTPSGQIVHAEGEARARTALEQLRGAALAMDRARSRLRNKDGDSALEMWRVLVDGEWSLVDRFERDGRRYVVAHRNSPLLHDPRALTLRERQVAMFTALGHAAKLIAYELGISASAVSAARHGAMKKLGVTTLAELTRLLKALRPSDP